jgi:PAS domain S-box-containing protein
MNGDFIKVNQAFADLMGRQIKDLIGMSYQSFTPKKLESEDREQIDEFQKSGQIGPFEKEYIHVNDHLVPIRMIVKKIRIGNRNYKWIVAENYSTETYRVLFQKTTVGLALCQWDGTFVSVNETYANITGWTVDELLGRIPGRHRMTYWQITPKELHDQQEKEQLRNLEATGRYGPYSKNYLRKDGTQVPVTLTGVRLKIDDKDYIWSIVDKGLAELPSLPSSTADLQPIRELPTTPLSCFISYSSHDEEFASMLYAELRARNLQVWFAPAKLRPGDKLNEAIAQGIDASDRLLLVLSKGSMKSIWVKEELRKARRIEDEQGVRKLIPIRLVEYEAIQQWHSPEWKFFWFGFGADNAEVVRSYFIPDFSQWQNPERFNQGLESLLDVLLQRGEGPRAP